MTGTKYIDRCTAKAIRNPSMRAFGATFLAFLAGCELTYHLTTQLSRSFTFAALFIGILFLVVAVERSYFLARAICQLSNSGPRSSAS
jgi:hypothetical protein